MKKKTTKTKKIVKKKPVVKKKVGAKKNPGRSTTAHRSAERNKSRQERPRGAKQLAPRPIGRVSHYFDNIKVAAIKLKAPLKKGNTIRIEGGEVVVKIKISSMQKNHKAVALAKARDEIGIKVSKKVREGYRVFKA